MLKGKTVILGVTGGIAAYKSATLVSRLKNLGADVWVVMTAEATKLVGPLTFRTLSGNPVITDLFAEEIAGLPVPHITLAKKADLLVIAPCTANVIGKMAHGLADDALTTIALAATAPKLLAPAMNCEMWRNRGVQENLKKLKDQAIKFVGPVEGKLACGDDDIGRMAEPETILEEVVRWLGGSDDLKGKHILVTAGGTREAIDPVRYIANHSSGKMGYALAEAARARGATVTLIAANVDRPAPLDIKPVKVGSAAEMLGVVMDNQGKADAIIMAAAVGDFKVKNQKSKVKKNAGKIDLELEENADIIATVAKQKGKKGRKLIGFALETEDLIQNAKLKMKNKGLDLIVANGPDTFGSEQATVSIINQAGKVENLPKLPKSEIANRILDAVLRL
ncbi:MAG: bifunctional phosphopantothenoylcysteine decarboxylase/phosphopantothenate--cysteine ligase CoaBC [Candidatus Margulisbacteria bacterium]|jgi:phosphopantothenoylcysteine decarboxylase/phosphopantothenate--cysteine ligase|nr:bifunctional phosphopantothenoylcysteine decarboxylase/phosphopantothenate--cysteine ligase CoaBC [Candidatus Margulisiibacteriota bacterium]